MRSVPSDTSTRCMNSSNFSSQEKPIGRASKESRQLVNLRLGPGSICESKE
jgi:hypothetical protein